MSTPIKVRGKRKRPGDDSSPAPSSPSTSESRLAPEGRKKKSKRTIESASIKPRNLSTIEKLPAELLVEILLESKNVQFPCASPFISAKVSSPSVYVAFFKRVFRVSKDTPEGPEDLPERIYWPNLDFISQSLLLSRRWVTAEFWIKMSKGHWIDDFEVDVCLPARLLRLPLDDHNMLLLEEWWGRGARFDFINTTAGELLAEALRDAIQRGFTKIIIQLCEAAGPEIFNRREMLHLAIQSPVYHARSQLLTHLIDYGYAEDDDVRNREEHLADVMDPKLWAWAREDREAGGMQGREIEFILHHEIERINGPYYVPRKPLSGR
ncbi:MAG: hypothetical protein M4579_006762 [Chaenotheca gracillima]|nr:MAG: hypothetical protein M4579_006762 [Chaenotheca gracillima]